MVTAILVVLSGNFMGCETEDWVFEVNCDDCYNAAPDSANLIVHLTINSTYQSVPLTFYRGPYENGEIDWQDTATSENFYLYSAVDQEYTVKATYSSGSETIIAFDGDIMVVNDAADACGSPCHVVKGGIFELQLID